VTRITRRTALRAGLTGGAAMLAGGLSDLVTRLAAQACGPEPLGDLVKVIALQGDRARRTPFGETVGGPGLDARLFTDLSLLQPDRLITPTAEVFVRTAAPPPLRSTPAAWTLAAPGFATASFTIDTLRREARPMGAHLIECSGNADPDNFGLMSVADWDGVPLADVVARLGLPPSAHAIAVSGVDNGQPPSRSSTPGASWIFPLNGLERLGAFLAVRMNGAALTPDHGAPVRLVVPGWYGCSWIKWVQDLRPVPADEPVTSQMIEFSLRTHQGIVPRLAREYDPPVIDLAATPVRVEQRRVNGRLEYRIFGIVWGGERPVDRLAIRFTAREEPKPFAVCPAPTTHRTWSLWSYRWQPSEPGIYDIVLKAADSSIRTRRLDISYYLRRVVIDEV
jgi:DMSO/TMAO reductase YedYZ molybdopterin-dependent catalytic subunit